MEIKALREKIDMLDGEIQRLLCERFEVVKKIGEEKKKLKKSVCDTAREKEILDKIDKLPYEKDVLAAVKNLYEEIFVFAKELQNN